MPAASSPGLRGLRRWAHGEAGTSRVPGALVDTAVEGLGGGAGVAARGPSGKGSDVAWAVTAGVGAARPWPGITEVWAR